MAKAGALGQSTGGLTELKHRLLFVLIGIIIFRMGAYIPVPGINPVALQTLFNQHTDGMLGLFNMFSGGALRNFTVFALGVMPYISASIIIQLLTSVLPSLSELKKEGEMGQRKINQYIRYFTVILSFFQAIGISRWLVSQNVTLSNNPGFTFYFVATITLVTGTMFLMWLGEQMTERGIGNGISMIIFAGIVSRLPSALGVTLEQVREGQMSVLVLLLIVVIVLAVTGFVVFMERAQRRITINYAKRVQGRRMTQAQSSHLPLKLNMSGVIPAIFASSIIMFPATLALFLSHYKWLTWLSSLSLALQVGQPIYMVLFAAAVIFFSFFYAALVFNPRETAENLKKSGAFVPGIRPGDQTARYIDTVMTRLTLAGALYIVIVCLVPQLMIRAWNVPFYFGGTSLLIIVVVVMDFIAQLQAHLMSLQYESLLKKSGNAGGFGLLK